MPLTCESPLRICRGSRFSLSLPIKVKINHGMPLQGKPHVKKALFKWALLKKRILTPFPVVKWTLCARFSLAHVLSILGPKPSRKGVRPPPPQTIPFGTLFFKRWASLNCQGCLWL